MRVVPRSAWGATRPLPGGSWAPKWRGRLWLHHTDLLPASAGLGRGGVRWVQGFHMGSRGYIDVGYPFLYSPRTREVYMGRSATIAGAHTLGNNASSHALAVLGNYHGSRPDPLPDHVVADLAAFLLWYRTEGYGNARFDGGHRDAPGNSTACPGDHLHRLIPRINTAAANQESPMGLRKLLAKTPRWAERTVTAAYNEGIVTEDTDPRRKFSSLTLAEMLAFRERGFFDTPKR